MTAALWTSFAPADTVFEPGRIAVAARGHRIEYADGSTRLCATSGLWNVPFGYGNPVVAEAVDRAMRDASYLSLFRAPHRAAMEAADALVDRAGSDAYARAIFSTAGGAANDAVMKLVRQFWAQSGRPERTVVVGLRGSYHGTMHGSHALSGDDLLQSVYALDRRGVRHVAHDDPDELESLLRREGDRVAAVVVEPVLGSGARVLPDGFVRRLLALREKHGFLLVADEIATGFARTGPLFATDRWAAPPDVLVLSKALTNGAVAAAAILVGPRIAGAFARGGWTFVHAETQAGTPVCAEAVLAVLREVDRIDAVATAGALGVRLRGLVDGLVADGLAAGVDGRGCFLAVRLVGADGAELTATEVLTTVAAVAERGVIVHPEPSGVGLIPAFGFGEDDLLLLDGALRGALAERRAESASDPDPHLGTRR